MKVSMSAKAVLLKIAAVFIIPFFVFLVACFGYGYVESYQRKVINNRGELMMYQSFLEEEVQKISYFMSDVVANSTAFDCFRYPQSNLDEWLNEYTLLEKFESIMKIDEKIDMMGIMTEENNVYGANYRRNFPYAQKELVERYLRDMVNREGEDSIGKWRICKIGETNYFLQVMGSKGAYCFCLVSMEHASQRLDSGYDRRYITFADGEGFLAYEEELEERRIRWKANASYLDGKWLQHLVISNYSEGLGCELVLIDSINGIWATRSLPIIVICVSFGFFLILMKCYRMVTERFLRPLSVMVETMGRIASGKLESTLVVGSDVEEYKRVETAFNDMIRQIGDLKILAYDRMIQAQQTQLQYYQIQIRPHFFLNCMKNLYAMAEEKKYERIQEMILSISSYLRSVFRNYDRTISLREELESVKSYIRLQQNQYAFLQYQEDVEEAFLDFQVPPISLLTFVENSFRYGRSSQEQFQIYIKVRLISDEEEHYLNITIKDNGNGFTDEALAMLNRDDEAPPKEHIGIYNVRQRFRILYGVHCSFVFSNMDGANVDIFVPTGGVDKEMESEK